MVDWASDTFKALIAASALWLASYTKKKIIPLYYALMRIKHVSERVDMLEIKVSVMDARQIALMNTDPNPVFTTDIKGGLTFANMAWLAAMGYSDLNHAKGKGYMQAIPEEHREMVEKLTETQITHLASFEGIIPFQHIKTLVRFKAMCRTEPLLDKDNIWIGTIGRLLILK